MRSVYCICVYCKTLRRNIEYYYFFLEALEHPNALDHPVPRRQAAVQKVEDRRHSDPVFLRPPLDRTGYRASPTPPDSSVPCCFVV